MQTTLLKLLRSDARGWWYHRQLRERGQTAEAIKLEHQSIRSSLRTLHHDKVPTFYPANYCIQWERGDGTKDGTWGETTSESNCHNGYWIALQLRFLGEIVYPVRGV